MPAPARPASGIWIVVPLWNQWDMTRGFLESLRLAQPALDFRVVAVDNGSSDATRSALGPWRRRLPLTVLRNARNRGVAPAWNQGLRVALKGGARWFGWCFLLSRRAVEAVGSFDESYRMAIGEDEDYFHRLAAAGLRYGVSGSAFVHHWGSASLGQLRQSVGKDFEEANLARLRARWGAGRAARWRRWAAHVGHGWQRLRWGHLLKE